VECSQFHAPWAVAPLWTVVACRAKKRSRADARRRRRRRPTLFLSHTLRLLWACGDRVCGVSRVCGFIFWGTFNQHVFSLGGGFAACWNPSILLAGLAAGWFVPWKAYARPCLLLESSSMLSSFVEASSNGMPRIMHARTHARTHTRQEFHQVCLYVRALFCLNIGAPTKRNPLCTTLHAMSETRTRHTRISRARLGGTHGERLSFVCSSRNDEDRRICFLCSYLLHPACGCL